MPASPGAATLGRSPTLVAQCIVGPAGGLLLYEPPSGSGGPGAPPLAMSFRMPAGALTEEVLIRIFVDASGFNPERGQNTAVWVITPYDLQLEAPALLTVGFARPPFAPLDARFTFLTRPADCSQGVAVPVPRWQASACRPAPASLHYTSLHSLRQPRTVCCLDLRGRYWAGG